MPSFHPAYRIHTPRLVLRCWEPADAPRMKEAIDASLEHLRPWMPWAHHEPEAVDAKVQRLRRFRGHFDLNDDFVYGVFDGDEHAVLGGTGLHPRVGAGALEIGYWIHADHVNRGYATELSAALTKVAFEIHRVQRVEIHCDSLNVASASVPRKLAFTHEGTLRQRTETAAGEPRDTMVWTLLADEYPASPAHDAEIQAFDVVGRRLL